MNTLDSDMVANISHISFLQINASRCERVSDQLLEYANAQNIDVIAIQEPYTRRGKLTGFEAMPLRVELSKGRLRPGLSSLVHGAAIVIMNPGLRVLSRPDLSHVNFAVVTIEGEFPLTIVSGYFKYREFTGVHCEILSGILDRISGNVIIAIDANAFSRRWFSRTTDLRGDIVEQFIIDRQLTCHNKRSRYTTFAGNRG